MLDQKIDEASGLIREIFRDHSEPACVTCSFQTDCMAILDLLIQQKPDIPVLFLDTGYHFAETYAYRDQMARDLKLNLVNLLPKLTVPAQESQFGILVSKRAGPLLWNAEGRAALCGTGELRHLVHRAAPRTVSNACELTNLGSISLAQWKAFAQGESLSSLDECRRLGLSEEPRHSHFAFIRKRLHQHRLRALYHAAARSRESALGALGRAEARVRNPYFKPIAPWRFCSDS